jgi:hypothetical protein
VSPADDGLQEKVPDSLPTASPAQTYPPKPLEPSSHDARRPEVPTVTHADVLKRLERLERQRLVLLFVSVLALAAAGTCIYLNRASTAPPSPLAHATVEAERFNLKDSNGKVCATWAATNVGNGFAINDEQGRPRILLGATQDGALLSILDENMKNRLELSGNKNGPGLTLYDENGKVRALLTIGIEEGLVLVDENGNDRIDLRILKTGEAGLIVRDQLKRPRAGVTVGQRGPACVLLDEFGRVAGPRP